MMTLQLVFFFFNYKLFQFYIDKFKKEDNHTVTLELENRSFPLQILDTGSTIIL